MSTGHDRIYAITTKGTNELKSGATTLAPSELELLVLVDGRRPVSAIAALSKSDAAHVESALRNLLLGGHVRDAKASDRASEGFDYFFGAQQPIPEPSPQALERAAHEAVDGASALREHGYYVSIARRAQTPARPMPPSLTVLVVEDEPLVAKYLKALVEMEGHVPRMAANREEIVAELRKAPLPDLVILDVMLPDTNGFHVLQRMKSHPAIADVPVMIVTTQATRESVMKGLALGADGYFTKPFEVDVLLRGMKAVLGLLPPDEKFAATAPTASRENESRRGKW